MGTLCWGLARLIGRITGRDTPYWRALLPWLAAQFYLAIGLLAAPSPPTWGMAAGAAVTGVLTLLLVLVAGRGGRRRGRALFIAWAVPWAAAIVFSLF